MPYFTPGNSNLAAARNTPYDLYWGYGPLQDLEFFNVAGVVAAHLIKLQGKEPSRSPKSFHITGASGSTPGVFTWEPVSYDGNYFQYTINGLVIRFNTIGDVHFQVTTGAQSGVAATDKAAIATAMDALLTAVAAGNATTGVYTLPANAYMFPENSNVTDAQIITQLLTLYAADGTGFVAAAGILTATTATNSAAFNDIGVQSYVRNGLPTPRVTINAQAAPDVPMLNELGIKVDFKKNSTNKKVNVPDDTTFFDAGEFQSGIESGATVTIQQGRDFKLKVIAQGNYTIMNDGNRQYLAPGGSNELMIFHLILVRAGVRPGAREILVIPACTTGGFEDTYNKENIPTIAGTFKPALVSGYAKSSAPLFIEYEDYKAA